MFTLISCVCIAFVRHLRNILHHIWCSVDFFNSHRCKITDFQVFSYFPQNAVQHAIQLRLFSIIFGFSLPDFVCFFFFSFSRDRKTLYYSCLLYQYVSHTEAVSFIPKTFENNGNARRPFSIQLTSIQVWTTSRTTYLYLYVYWCTEIHRTRLWASVNTDASVVNIEFYLDCVVGSNVCIEWDRSRWRMDF